MIAPARDWTATAARVIDVHLADNAQATRRAYANDLAVLARFVGAATSAEAVAGILASGPGDAYALAVRWKAQGRDTRAPATVNRRLSMLRGLARTARKMQVVDWTIDVSGLPAHPYRDTRGPGRQAIRDILDIAEHRHDARGYRDAALIRLLYDLGLRTCEAVTLELRHVDLRTPAVHILAKRWTQRQAITLPLQTHEALARHIVTRGAEAGPIFTSHCNRTRGRGLTPHGLYQVVRAMGRKIGLHVTPHGIRHSATTAAVELGRPLTDVRQFARHKRLETTGFYIDTASDIGSDVARDIAETL